MTRLPKPAYNGAPGGYAVALAQGADMTGDELKAARKALGMTQAELADALGLTAKNGKDTVRAWEADRRPVSGPVAMLLRYIEKYGPLLP